MRKAPLAERLRPHLLEEVIGQDHLLGPKGFLTQIQQSNQPISLLLWGPPGCGKTTLARAYAKTFQCRYLALSAIFTGSADLKKIIQEIEEQPLLYPQTLLFIDEIHRFNKAQQDIFLPFVEKGLLTLIGATTENPSFALNDALLSRLRVLTLKPLDPEHLDQIISRCETVLPSVRFTEPARRLLIEYAQGDARHLINLIENFEHIQRPDSPVGIEELEPLTQRRPALYDKQGEGHYNLISALHKSIRGSDPDAALYWFARMLEGGEDPHFIARRLVRAATEDIALAEPASAQSCDCCVGDVRSARLSRGRARSCPARRLFGPSSQEQRCLRRPMEKRESSQKKRPNPPTS